MIGVQDLRTAWIQAAPIALIILLATAPTTTPQHACAPDVGRLRAFLEHQYVESVGLLRAGVTSPGENTTIYTANDNILAAEALRILGSPLAERIYETLLQQYPRYTWNKKVDVLLAQPIKGVFGTKNETILKQIGIYTVKWDGMNFSNPMDDWREYADLLVYHALNSLLHGDRIAAEEDYEELIAMWDGWGFHDKVREKEGLYDAYKLALAYYLHRALEAAGSSLPQAHADLAEKWLCMLALLQDEETGGITARYKAGVKHPVPVGDPNTETASMTVLALYSDYPELIAGPPTTPPEENPVEDTGTPMSTSHGSIQATRTRETGTMHSSRRPIAALLASALLLAALAAALRLRGKDGSEN